MTNNFNNVIREIKKERERQDEKWGDLNKNLLTFQWVTILTEEIGEVAKDALDIVYGKASLEDLREELIHVAAVAIQWLECLERDKKND